MLTLWNPVFGNDIRVVPVDPGLDAGRLQRWLVGAGYRELWRMPIKVEVLDLRTFAGGLTPRFRVGGQQTRGLALSGADGRSYTFRGLVKDLSAALPPDFREYLIDDIVQDQLAAAHPVGPVIVAPLATAAGIPHTTPLIVVMPDDAALGEFRQSFAGVIGTLEEYPTAVSSTSPGFEGATEILSSKNLWQKAIDDPTQRADARAFLRARLLDFMVGDWDRHPKQWRWASIPGKTGWQPIPEDRDQAFSTYEGALLSLFRPYQPKFTRFETEYPSPKALTLQGWEIHRWVLAELERDVWLEIADDMRRRLTDEVIDAAVGRMPGEYVALDATALSETLKSRRDQLPAYADEVYEFLAREVDVQGTNQAERLNLANGVDGSLTVSVIAADGMTNPYFNRTFHAAETRSVRIYVRGGSDVVACTGEGDTPISIQVVSEPDVDVFEGCGEGQPDFMSISEFERRQRPIDSQPVPDPDETLPWDRVRDWGWQVVPVYRVGLSSSLGTVVGGGITAERYRFGRTPYEHKQSVQGAYSFELDAFDLSYAGTYRHREPRLSSNLAVHASGFELSRFYGFGNETNDEGDDDFFETEQMTYGLEPSVRYTLSPSFDLAAGGRLRYSSTDSDDDTLLTQIQPYGIGDFGEVGLFAGIEYDTRDDSPAYAPGVRGRVQGTWVPELADVESPYGSIEGEVAGYHDLSDRLMVSARLVAKKVFGTFPFQSAAYLGGFRNLRGYVSNRFAGEASILLNAEVRHALGHASALFFRGEWGVFAFADAGRVWLDGEDSNDWHPSAGGGVSLATLERRILVLVTVARGEEDTTFFFQSGFSF